MNLPMQRLLVVDDNEGLTNYVAYVAGALGFSARQCNDPFKALDEFVDFRPDVVLVDVCMPEKDGLDLLHEILLTEIPVRIIVTTGFDPAFLDLALGVANFHGNPNITTLAKPFQRNELAEVLTPIAA